MAFSFCSPEQLWLKAGRPSSEYCSQHSLCLQHFVQLAWQTCSCCQGISHLLRVWAGHSCIAPLPLLNCLSAGLGGQKLGCSSEVPLLSCSLRAWFSLARCVFSLVEITGGTLTPANAALWGRHSVRHTPTPVAEGCHLLSGSTPVTAAFLVRRYPERQGYMLILVWVFAPEMCCSLFHHLFSTVFSYLHPPVLSYP